MLRAAHAVAAREGVVQVVIAQRTRDRLGAGQVEVRMLHAATRWRPSALLKPAGRGARVYVVSAEGVRAHAPGAFDLAAARALCAVQAAPAEPAAA